VFPVATAVLESASSSDAGLTAFVGLTALVVTGFLALARASQRLVDEPGDGSGPAGEGGPERGTRTADAPDERTSSPFRAPPAPAPNEPDAVDGDAPHERAVPSETADGRELSGTDPDREAGDAAAEPSTAPEQPSTAPEQPSTAPEQLSPGALLANVALTQGLFGAVLVGGAIYFEVPAAALGLAATDLSTGPTALAAGIGLGVALWLGNELATGVADAVGAGYDEGLREMLAPASAGGWALLLGVTLPAIAVVEEFIFRAAAVGATTAAFAVSPWAVAVVASVAFALGHGAQGRVGILVTGTLGFALAAAFVLTNSLLVVVVAHYLVNALEFLVHERLGVSDPVWD